MPQTITKWFLFRKLAIPIFLVLALILIGTIGYMIIDDFTLLNAIYMSVITVGTVGYEETQRVSPAGMVFTIFLILASMGTVAYYITMVTRVLLDGEWRKQYKLYKLSKKLKTMENHVIVCGYGRNGHQACDILAKSGRAFTVVEQRAHLVTEAEEVADVILSGDATQDDVLIEAGILHASALIAALPNDADNLFVVLTARQLNPKITIISRASSDQSVKKLKIAGANNVIMPDKLGGAHMASLVLIPNVHEFLSLLSTQQNTEFQISEIEIKEAVNLGELNLWHRTGCTILGIKQTDGHYHRNPSPDYILMEGETLIVMGSQKVTEAARKIIAAGDNVTPSV